jgi:hypothetical protein
LDALRDIHTFVDLALQYPVGELEFVLQLAPLDLSLPEHLERPGHFSQFIQPFGTSYHNCVAASQRSHLLSNVVKATQYISVNSRDDKDNASHPGAQSGARRPYGPLVDFVGIVSGIPNPLLGFLYDFVDRL